jgi:two-component system, chemotaxis family, chemotaxis protein CheY
MTELPVMIVDDDDDVRDMLALVLEGYGYSTVKAKDGIDALDQLREGANPRLIFLDLRMPRMNGIEFLEALHADQRRATIPVVVMTGDPMGMREASRSAPTRCLRKPLDIHQILESIHQLAP